MDRLEWKKLYREQRLARIKEVWKDIPLWEWRYQVSNLGNVKSLNFKNTWKEKLLKLQYDKYRYLTCWINQKSFKVHRLISMAFIPNPENKKCVNHKNWIKYDNRLENLEWNTYSENSKHSYSVLWRIWAVTWKFWKLHHRAKKVCQFSLDWKLIKEWDSMVDVQRELWINHSHISACCNWKARITGGYIWKFS